MDLVGRYLYNGGLENGTAKVGSYLPNAWGLYDMHGNVMEWCLDSYGTYSGTVTDPLGPASGFFVMRGGSWFSDAYDSRSAFRNHDINTNYGSLDNDPGFRLLRTVP